MIKTLTGLAAAGLVLMLPASAFADDVTGADRILCTAVQATVCDFDDGCESGPPWTWNIPQFVEIDLKGKTMGTTKASGENRVTPIASLTRVDGVVILQGVEAGRGFSLVIREAAGTLSSAIAIDELTISVFGACTPLQ